MGDRYVRARARVPRMLRDALWAAVERSREAAGGWLAPATVDGVIEGKPVRVLVGVSEHRLHVSVSRADVRRLRAGLSLPSWDDLVSVRACCWPDDVEVVPCEEMTDHRWIDRRALDELESPANVRQFGHLALDASIIPTG